MTDGVSTRNCLKKATSRAKSDVANKMVSMFLHELSRRIASDTGLVVSDSRYADVVEELFGDCCAFCSRQLQAGRLAVEHLEGMNRHRVGLHVPGNVVVACAECNREKRRDDQTVSNGLCSTGWESFLSHDGTRCLSACKTCLYWQSVWPSDFVRVDKLNGARKRIHEFQAHFQGIADKVASLRSAIQRDVETLYRDSQDFAQNRIQALANHVLDRA